MTLRCASRFSFALLLSASFPACGARTLETSFGAGGSGEGGAGGASAGGGGSGGSVKEGITAPLSAVPSQNVFASNLDPSSEVLEVLPGLTCADTSVVFNCSHQGFSVVFPPEALALGSFDLSLYPAAQFTWLGTCGDGGGGLARVVQGTLTVNGIGPSLVAGTVDGLVEQLPGSQQMAPPFAFEARRCTAK